MASYSKRTRKNKDGSISISWIGQINENGKRKSFYGKKKKEVEQKINDYLADLNTYGTPLSVENVPLAKWIDSYLFSMVIHEVSPSTFERYKGIYDNYLEDSIIASINIKEITLLQLQTFFNQHTHLSHGSLKKIYFLLNKSFNAAIKNNLIRLNPLVGVIIPNKHIMSKEIQILTIDQQRTYCFHAKNETHGLLCITTLFTGMRLGEIIALRWANVDLNNNVIYVKESIKASKIYKTDGSYIKEDVTKLPKSKSGIREIPIPSGLSELLLKHKPIDTSKDIDNMYVFSTSNDTHILDSNVRRMHNKICTNAKINPIKVIKNGKTTIKYNGVSFHALRHTFASRMIEAGESVKVVQKMLGHKDVETTLNIYTHVLSETLRAAADKQQALYEQLTS